MSQLSSPSPRRGWPILLLAVAAAALSGCAIGADANGALPQNALNPAKGSVAVDQDQLWDLVFPIAVGVFVFVEGLIVFAIWRFRGRGRHDTRVPRQIHGNTRLELLWSFVPALLLVVIAVPTVRTVFALAARDPGAMNVRVIAKQYWWEFEYEDPAQLGVVVANELHIPTGREIQLDMQSVSSSVSYDPDAVPEGEVQPIGEQALGVIHSFWVPRLAGKQDVVPGHTREMKIRAAEPGVYEGQCAEFCGLGHPLMRLRVVAHEPDAFSRWIREQNEPADTAGGALASRGEREFVQQGCVACHAVDGNPNIDAPRGEQARVGPDLTHFASRARFAGGLLDNDDPQAIAAWLRNPQREKPGAQMPNLNLSEGEIDALVAYLQTLD